MADNVKFVHYCGTNTNWNRNKDTSKWNNSIVFGKIRENRTWQYKIFAGNVYVPQLNSSIDYEYNIADASEFQTLQSQVLNISSLFETLNTSVDTRITNIENKIDWVEISDN